MILTQTSDPVISGQWEPIKYKFQSLPVHIALLYTGKVLAFGGSGNDPKYLNSPHPAEIFESDQMTVGNGGRIYSIPNQELEGDIFCSGHSFLPDGKLLVAGGTYKYDHPVLGIPFPPFSGLEHSYIFHPETLTWQKAGNMSAGRWYPTCIMIPDGSVITMAGLTRYFPWVILKRLEVFTPERSWTVLKNADHWLPLYPRVHLLPSGKIFYAGSFNTHYTFPFSVKGFPSATLDVGARKWRIIGNPNNVNREEGTTVLLPLNPPDYSARVLLIAGGTPQGKDAIDDVEIINFSDDVPKYRPFEHLIHARYYVYPVILPDQSVFIVGGKSGQKGHLHNGPMLEHEHHHPPGELPHHPGAILEPELLDPKTSKWKPMADMIVDRLYHSNALLLPDGRVMTAGSNPHRTENELRIEIFRPPYLFRGERPTITMSPDRVLYGKPFELETPEPDTIEEISLIRPSVTTHCVNTEQRYVGLEFLKTATTRIKTSVPPNKNLAPPGYYMLFLLNKNRIPSLANFIHLS